MLDIKPTGHNGTKHLCIVLTQSWMSNVNQKHSANSFIQRETRETEIDSPSRFLRALEQTKVQIKFPSRGAVFGCETSRDWFLPAEFVQLHRAFCAAVICLIMHVVFE